MQERYETKGSRLGCLLFYEFQEGPPSFLYLQPFIDFPH
jgi:hypothetical protein